MIVVTVESISSNGDSQSIVKISLDSEFVEVVWVVVEVDVEVVVEVEVVVVGVEVDLGDVEESGTFSKKN